MPLQQRLVYRIFDSLVASAVPLPLAVGPLDGTTNFDIVWADALSPGHFPNGGQFDEDGLRVEDVDSGWFLSYDFGARIHVDTYGRMIRLLSPLPSRERSAQALVNSILPLAAGVQGRHVFHAASVLIGGRAVLLVGPSGRGKSTLSVALSRLAGDLLSDDCVILDRAENGFAVIPSYPSLRLWGESLAGLGLDGSLARKMVGYANKYEYRQLAGGVFGAEGWPELAAIVLIEPPAFADRGINIVRANRFETFRKLTETMFRLDTEDLSLMEEEFEFLGAVLSQTPILSIEYSREFGLLPEVCRRLLDALERTARCPAL